MFLIDKIRSLFGPKPSVLIELNNTLVNMDNTLKQLISNLPQTPDSDNLQSSEQGIVHPDDKEHLKEIMASIDLPDVPTDETVQLKDETLDNIKRIFFEVMLKEWRGAITPTETKLPDEMGFYYRFYGRLPKTTDDLVIYFKNRATHRKKYMNAMYNDRNDLKGFLTDYIEAYNESSIRKGYRHYDRFLFHNDFVPPRNIEELHTWYTMIYLQKSFPCQFEKKKKKKKAKNTVKASRKVGTEIYKQHKLHKKALAVLDITQQRMGRVTTLLFPNDTRLFHQKWKNIDRIKEGYQKYLDYSIKKQENIRLLMKENHLPQGEATKRTKETLPKPKLTEG